MFLVAVDVGYSNLKVLSGPMGLPPATVVLAAGAGPQPPCRNSSAARAMTGTSP